MFTSVVPTLAQVFFHHSNSPIFYKFMGYTKKAAKGCLFTLRSFYIVHADSYPRIEKPKNMWPMTTYFHWGSLVISQDARHLGMVPLI